MNENINIIQKVKQLEQGVGPLEEAPITAIEEIRQQWEQLATFISDPHSLDDGTKHMYKIFVVVNTVDLKALEQALTEQDEEENRISRLDANSKFTRFQAEL